MIEKIRKTLIIKYTIIIACILFFGFIASYIAYRHNGIKLMQDGLRDYLTEELWEAKETVSLGIENPELHKVRSDINSMHYFTYWYVDGKIVRAERPYEDAIAEQLKQTLSSKTFISGEIYHENFKHNKQKWYFMLLKGDLKLNTSQKGEVFVLANYTPIRQNAKAYVKIALSSAIIMILLAYFLGSFFATRSMKYIERSYQKQKQFVSDAAHEFRTPLTVLYSYAELLEYNPKKKEIITDIKNELQQMSDLIDRLLAIAKYDNNKVIKKVEVFSLNNVVKEVIKATKTLSVKGTINFLEQTQGIKIEADKVMIRQLIGIILDNAVKYTNDDRKIDISIEKQKATVTLKIKDNGIGIKESDLPHIFDRFWRAEQSRHNQGLGLGLALADTIIKTHKGSIRVESKPNVGTSFEITLPIKQN